MGSAVSVETATAVLPFILLLCHQRYLDWRASNIERYHLQHLLGFKEDQTKLLQHYRDFSDRQERFNKLLRDELGREPAADGAAIPDRSDKPERKE